MNITELPSEVLHVIVAGQSQTLLKVLRQVCRLFNELAEPLLFSGIALTYSKDPNLFYNLLESLADGTTNIGSHVRNLTVTRLTPDSEEIDDMYAEVDDPEHHHNERMKECFPQAIGSLKGLRRVSWVPFHSDPQWMLDCVIQCLLGPQMLEELSLEWDDEISGEICLNGISNLKKLCIEASPMTLFDGLLAQIVSIISSSPNLTSLTLATTDFDSEEEELTFNSLFAMLPPSLPPLRLTDVTSVRFPLRLDATSLPHLKEVKSLKLKGTPDNEPDDVDGNELEDWNIIMGEAEREEEEGEEIGEGADNGSPRWKLQPNPVLVDEIQSQRPLSTTFWNTLRLSGIQLERLDLEDVDHAALAYLASYSGLQALHFPDVSVSRLAVGNHLATMFYLEVFPKHLTTLEELTLVSTYVSGWSISPSNLQLFSQCKNLTALHVTWDPDAAGSTETFYSLLDVSKTFPHLHSLRFTFFLPLIFPHATCGHPWEKRRMEYHVQVKDIFPMYERAEITKSPCMVQVDDLKFELRRYEDSELAGYQYQFIPSKRTRRK